jgi:hypothetical protein
MTPPDREALLVALVLAPATYSRNRFFALYTDPEIRRVRRRATQIRSIVRHVAGERPAAPGELCAVEPQGEGAVRLTYVVPSIGLRRTALLDPLEIALVRYAMARSIAGAAPLAPDDPDRRRIEEALSRLGPTSRSSLDAG